MRSPMGVGIKLTLPHARRMVGLRTSNNCRRLGTEGPIRTVQFYLSTHR